MSPVHPHPVSLLEALRAIDDHAPTTDADLASLPPRAVMAKEKSRLLALIDPALAAARETSGPEALEAKRPAYEESVRRLQARVVKRSRSENLALIAQLMARSPAGAQLAYRKKFTNAAEEELDLLVAELQALEDPE